MQLAAVDGGFTDPVLEAQAAFRAIMDAMARPGTVHILPAGVVPPAPLSPAAAAIALTLCDQDTPIWLDPVLRQVETVAAWLAFHAGTPFSSDPKEACFALVAAPGDLVALEQFEPGTDDYPDRSATLILQVATLAGGAPLRLVGPGIPTTAQLAPAPLPPLFVDQWRQNRVAFPRGVDLILAAPEGAACLPRTTRVEAVKV